MVKDYKRKDPRIILVTVRQYCYNCFTKKNKIVTCVDGNIRDEKCKKCGFLLGQKILTEGD